MFGDIRRQRGNFNERKAQEALSKSGNLPEWISSVRKATREEDRKGIDLIASTDVGDIYLQIKSSVTGKRHHEERYGHKNIACAVIRINDPEETVRGKCIRAIQSLRDKYIQKREAAWAEASFTN